MSRTDQAGYGGSSTGEHGQSEPLGRARWTALVVLTLSTFIVVLDVSVVFITLPTILSELNGSLELGTWVIAAFILPFAVLLLPAGYLSDAYGRRRFCIIGLSVFTLASLACSVSPTIEVLILARIFQGVGAAMVEPTVLALIKATFPRGRLGLAFGVQGVAAGVAASIGPTLGGVLTSVVGWESVFLINVPVGVVAIIGILLTVSETNRSHMRISELDGRGTLLSCVGLTALFFGIIEGAALGWSSLEIIACFAVAAICFPLFIVVELRSSVPLVPLGLFRERMFLVGNILRGAIEFANLGVFFPLALFIQVQLGYSALQTGLILLPLVIGSFITSPLGGSLSDRIDVRLVVVPGLIVSASGLAWLSFLSPDDRWTDLLGPLVVVGLGLGSLYGATTSATLRHVPSHQDGVAGGISYAAFLLGSEAGIATVGALLIGTVSSNLENAAVAANLSPSALDGVSRSIVSGPLGDGGSLSSLPAGLEAVVGVAFTNGVSVSVLLCAVVLGGAAILGLWFSPRQASPGTSEARRAE